jgi:hypothetical protein
LEAFSLGTGALVCHVAGGRCGVGLLGLAVGVFSRLRDAVACFRPFYHSRHTKLTVHISSAADCGLERLSALALGGVCNE